MVSNWRNWQQLIIALIIILVPALSLSMTDNGDGTRTFTVGSGEDFEDYASIVWGHPAGVRNGDKLIISSKTYQILETGSEYKAFTYVNVLFFGFFGKTITIYSP